MQLKEVLKLSLRVYESKKENLDILMIKLGSDFETEIVEVDNLSAFKYVLIISDLDRCKNIDELLRNLEFQESVGSHINLFVSFSSEDDITGFSFTKPMIEIISRTKCSVDVSLIFIS